eukprot:2875265-Ditylum_brightwellii.AAC.1
MVGEAGDWKKEILKDDNIGDCESMEAANNENEETCVDDLDETQLEEEQNEEENKNQIKVVTVLQHSKHYYVQLNL